MRFLGNLMAEHDPPQRTWDLYPQCFVTRQQMSAKSGRSPNFSLIGVKLPYRTLGADQRAAVAAILGRIIPAPTKARAAINGLESSWQRAPHSEQTVN
jgi:hypothetical protein